MKKENRIVRIGGICFLAVLFVLSFCYVAGAGPNDKIGKTDVTEDDVWAARSETHYDLYYANKELRKLIYLNPEYDRLNDIFNKAERAWYKGQYYMDLVTCGEITEEHEVQRYLYKALKYFNEAKTYANWVYKSLQH